MADTKNKNELKKLTIQEQSDNEENEDEQALCDNSVTIELRPKKTQDTTKAESTKRGVQDDEFDTRWSWAVLGGVFIIMMMNQLIIASSFGVMFSDYIKLNNIQTSVVTWIFNIQTFTWNIFAFLVGPLCNLFGWRQVTIIGSVLTGASIIITAFTNQQYQLFFSYSILSGIGGSLTTTVCLFILPHYWRKKKGFANGIMMTGSCLGSFLSPQIIILLQEELQFQWSMIIIGCLFIINCAVGLLFRPKKSAQIMNRMSTPTATSFSTIGLLAFSSTLTTGVVAGLDRNSYPLTTKAKVFKFFNSFSLIRQLSEALITSLKVLKYRRSLIIALVATVVFNSYFNSLALIPIIIRSRGYSSEASAWAVSVNAATSFVGRCVISAVSDLKIFQNKKGLLSLFGVLLLAASLLGFTLVNGAIVQLIMMGLQGLGSGIVISLYPLIIIDYMGLKYLPDTFGVASLFVAFGSITIGPLIGYIKDATESFDVSLQILSGFIFGGFLLCLFMPLAEKHDNKIISQPDKEQTKAHGTGTYRQSIIDP